MAQKLEELKKLKHFFEMVVNDCIDDKQEVGTFYMNITKITLINELNI